MGDDDLKKIEYLKNIEQSQVDHRFHENLAYLLNMGFFDFHKNLETLVSCKNDLNYAIQNLI